MGEREREGDEENDSDSANFALQRQLIDLKTKTNDRFANNNFEAPNRCALMMPNEKG